MNEAIFELETITPLFMAGADQREVPIPSNPEGVKFAWEYIAELRPPAFRGFMRYWLRAIIGGIVGTDEIGLIDVANAEQTIFGTTDKSSAIRLRIMRISHSPKKFQEDISTFINGEYQATGKGYLLWSMSKSGKGSKYKPHRWYFPSNTTFQIQFTARNQDAGSFSQAIGALWLLTNFGGMGSRSRRCGGSLMVKPLQPLIDKVANLPFKEAGSIGELKTLLEDGIQVVRSLFSNLELRPAQTSTFDVLSSDTCKIWIIRDKEGWKDSDEAMESIGESLQMYRKQFSEAKARKLLGKDIPLDRRGFDKSKALEIFGLPLGRNSSRRASPLLLRITKLQRGYVCIAVLFKTAAKDILPQNYAIIEDWIGTFPIKERIML